MARSPCSRTASLPSAAPKRYVSVSPRSGRLDAHRKAVLPGLIDSHAHAGHGMLRTMGAGDPDAWMNACGVIYTTASDEAFWRAESALASLERLKAGTTTGVSLLGGGDSIMRVDDPEVRPCALRRRRTRRDAIGRRGRTFASSRTPALRRLVDRAADFGRDRRRDDARGLHADRRRQSSTRRRPCSHRRRACRCSRRCTRAITRACATRSCSRPATISTSRSVTG